MGETFSYLRCSVISQTYFKQNAQTWVHITFDRSSQAAWGTNSHWARGCQVAGWRLASSLISIHLLESTSSFSNVPSSSPHRPLTTVGWKNPEKIITVPPSKYKVYQFLCTFIATIKNKLYVSAPLEPLPALRTRFYQNSLSVTFMWLTFCMEKHFMFAVIFLYSSSFQTHV